MKMIRLRGAEQFSDQDSRAPIKEGKRRMGPQMKIARLACLLAAAPASAQGLTGDWGGARTSLAESGVAVRGDVTGFAMGQIAGTGDKVWDSFGRYDAFVDLDFGKMGLIDGLGFHAHGEGRFGQGQGNFGFQLWPANTGAVLPLGGESFAASSLYFTQVIGKRSVLMLGKINAVDLLAGDPVFGGWGTQRFQNIASVAPPSGVVAPPPKRARHQPKGTPITLTLMVFDPEDRTRDYFPGDLFETGVNVSVAATWGGTIAGRASSVGVTSTVSTKRGADLEDILAPPGLVTDDIKGSYNIALQVTHRLVESSQVKGKGLDLAVKAAIADGNPNIIQRSLIIGLAGHGMIPGRPNDSFGIGGFTYDFSNALQDSTAPLVDFNDEQGLELWYGFALTPWFKLTADAQLINPARGDADTAIITGLRANLAF
jgi:porin